jgi:anti-sigma-K factor RskA
MTQAKPPLSDAERELAAGYILGDLAPEERMQFAVQLSENPALQAEVQALRVSLSLMSQGLEPVVPPPQLRDRVLAAQALSTVAPRRVMTWPIAMTGIAVLVALLSGFDNWRLRRDLSLAQKSSSETVAAILQRPKSRLVTLRSQPTASPAGTLLFTPGQWQEIVVSLEQVPPLPPDQTYHMWLTLNDGRVLLCGKFQPNAAGRVFVTLRPPQAPPKGIKATGVFVTLDAAVTPVRPQGDRVLSGEI